MYFVLIHVSMGHIWTTKWPLINSKCAVRTHVRCLKTNFYVPYRRQYPNRFEYIWKLTIVYVTNRAGWMKGICHIWSRGRHFSPSLPDRGSTGIWSSAHSISDPRAEISGSIVMVRRSGAMSRGTTYWFMFFPVSLQLSMRMPTFSGTEILTINVFFF